MAISAYDVRALNTRQLHKGLREAASAWSEYTALDPLKVGLEHQFG